MILGAGSSLNWLSKKVLINTNFPFGLGRLLAKSVLILANKMLKFGKSVKGN